MRAYLARHRKRLFWVVGIVIALLLFNWIFLGYSVDFFAKERLLAAKAAWNEAHIQDYRAIVEFSGGFQYRTQYLITVQNGIVIYASQKVMSTIDPQYNPDEQPFSSMPPEDAQRYMIDNIFESAIYDLRNSNFVHVNEACSRIEIDFDPLLRYINRYGSLCDGSLLGCAIGECAFLYKVIELEPLPPEP